MRLPPALLPVPLLAVAACAVAAPRAVGGPLPRVALALAEQRAAIIRDLRYDVTLQLPSAREAPVTGTVTATFTLLRGDDPLVLDFRAPPTHVRRVLLDGAPAAHTLVEDHIVIPANAARAGAHRVTIDFQSTDAALNRQDDFLYALFVPDRASTALPVFEQPDLKARWTLTLGVPAAWRAVANGALRSRDSSDAKRHTLRFAETEPISTYLFAFAAGMLLAETAEREGRTYTMYHRETDSLKVQRNRAAIFDLHARSLQWLEQYTQIDYPFGKFDFFAVPAFQFGGMEHPGAIWYRADALFLDPTASRTQELGRASLIAHETAHIWFGDLVTMRWFDDVWMKEVFANFMAAKIAGPAFPELDLPLRFFQAHLPAAYGVDRTAGANPIRQPLENLQDAGSLYGAIIYQKAPVVMQQLETLVGDTVFRDGLRAYLDRYRFGNATWPELIGILDASSPDDLVAWSRAWVTESGRPRITARWADSGVVLTQSDDRPDRALRWNEPIELALGVGDTIVQLRVRLDDTGAFAPLRATSRPDFILPGADGVGYGRFVLDRESRTALLARASLLPKPLHRAVAWHALWEEVLEDSLAAGAVLDRALTALETEPDELVAQQLLGLARNIYWRFLPELERRTVAPRLEAVLWRALDRASTPGRKGAYFGALVGVSLTPAGVTRLERIWRTDETPAGLPLAEQQYLALAEALALREVPNAEAILDEQTRRMTNPDRVARLRFMRPALSADPARRDSLFRTFADPEARRRESWVLDAMAAIHHPLRADASLGIVRAALELTEEIQRTGDIFFPLRWLNATLDGHRSRDAATIVQAYLDAHPDLPPRLRGKVRQAADELFRAAAIADGR